HSHLRCELADLDDRADRISCSVDTDHSGSPARVVGQHVNHCAVWAERDVPYRRPDRYGCDYSTFGTVNDGKLAVARAGDAHVQHPAIEIGRASCRERV